VELFKGLLWLCLVGLSASCSPDYTIKGHNEIYITVTETVIVGDTAIPEPIGEVWIDSFEQPDSTDGVDILIVIDTSCSMSDNETQLLAGVEAFMDNLPEADWRLNMISTSPDKVLTEQQFPLVTGDDIIDAQEMYDNMSRGTREEGFQSVQDYILSNPYASTWLRWDAALLIVFVSDEEEQSDMSVDDFTDWLNGYRSSVFMSSIINLDPKKSLCNVASYNTGYRYEEATLMYSGVVMDICSKDWTDGVRDASDSIDPISEWGLTYVPIKESVVVFVDGVPFVDWGYDTVENKVYFTVLPDGGSLVEIGYRYE
jgi:hypothetical protein